MKNKVDIGTIVASVCGIIAIVFAGLMLLGRVTVDLAIVVVGITQVLSGLMQMQMAQKAETEVIGAEKFKAAKFTLILGVIFLGLMAFKLIFIALKA